MYYKYTFSTVLLLCLISTSMATFNRTLLDTSYRVCGRKYNFPSQETKVLLKNAGKFISRNIIFTRFQFHGQSAFITEPRYKLGVPWTLSRVQINKQDYDVTVNAYPDWSSQEEGNCNAIQSAIDVFIDKNRVLWVLDAGVRQNLEIPDTKCAPKVVAISLLTNRITRTIDLSPLTTNSSNVQYLVVENYAGGDDYIYISDARGKAIIVFNAGAGKGRRLVLPDSVNSVCNDTNALYLALTKRNNDNNHLYFTYANCNNIYSIPTVSLTLGEPSTTINLAAITTKPILFLGTDGRSQLYFRLKQQSEVYVWDTNVALPRDGWKKVWNGEPERVATHVASGPHNLQWVLESNFESFVSNSTGCLGDCSKISPLTGTID